MYVKLLTYMRTESLEDGSSQSRQLVVGGVSCILETRVRQGVSLIDSWETVRACALGGAGVVCGWHGSRYNYRENWTKMVDREFLNDIEIMHKCNILASVVMMKVVQLNECCSFINDNGHELR